MNAMDWRVNLLTDKFRFVYLLSYFNVGLKLLNGVHPNQKLTIHNQKLTKH